MLRSHPIIYSMAFSFLGENLISLAAKWKSTIWQNGLRRTERWKSRVNANSSFLGKSSQQNTALPLFETFFLICGEGIHLVAFRGWSILTKWTVWAHLPLNTVGGCLCGHSCLMLPGTAEENWTQTFQSIHKFRWTNCVFTHIAVLGLSSFFSTWDRKYLVF